LTFWPVSDKKLGLNAYERRSQKTFRHHRQISPRQDRCLGRHHPRRIFVRQYEKDLAGSPRPHSVLSKKGILPGRRRKLAPQPQGAGRRTLSHRRHWRRRIWPSRQEDSEKAWHRDRRPRRRKRLSHAAQNAHSGRRREYKKAADPPDRPRRPRPRDGRTEAKAPAGASKSGEGMRRAPRLRLSLRHGQGRPLQGRASRI